MPATSRNQYFLGANPLGPARCAMLALLLLPACSKDEKSATTDTGPAPAAVHPAPVIPANATPLERVILLARSALGPDDKLNTVTSLELTGNVTDDKNQPFGQLVIMFKKPARMRSEVQTANGRMIQGSDGVAGWEFDVDKNSNSRNAVMPARDELQNIYETLENLYFYRGTEHVTGSSATVDGDAQYRGAASTKVTFHYPNNIDYVRYFNPASGKLLGTVLAPEGTEFVEEGEAVVNGITFPKILHEYAKDGQLVRTIVFEKVIVNPPLDDRLFDQPSLIATMASSPGPAGSSSAAKSTGNPPASRPAATSSTAPIFPMPELPTSLKSN